MAKITLQEALDNVEMTYQELNTIAKDIVSEFFAGADSLIYELKDINELDNDSIRNYMIKLSLTAYSLSEVKENRKPYKMLLKYAYKQVWYDH